MTKVDIGLILKNLRSESGMTQKEVAEAIGRKPQVIGHWETGYSQPDANTLFELCNLFNADINEAFGFTTTKVELTKHEKNVITAYRNNLVMQMAVDKLLDVPQTQTKKIYRAADGGGEHEIISDGNDTISKLNNRKDKKVTRIEDL